MKKKGLLLVISAPSGCGKTTLVEKLIFIDKKLKRSVSLTTRKARRDEKDGRDYFFVSPREFFRRRKNEELAEWAKIFGDFYGTPCKFIEETRKKGYDLILVIDVKGKKQVKRLYPESITIFIQPPSRRSLQERLCKRKSETSREMAGRLRRAKKELAASSGYDYRVTNDKIARALKQLKTIIAAERHRKNLEE